MNTWTFILILSAACVTFCDMAEVGLFGACADQVCPLICKKFCDFVPITSEGTNSNTSSQPEPYGRLCETVCEMGCKRLLGSIGISSSIAPAALGQFIELTIANETPEELLIANAYLKYGKWTTQGCDETSSPGGLTIPPKGRVQLKSCGRENSPSGTEGGFDIQVKAGSKQVANIYFDIPWAGSRTEFKVTNDPASAYMCGETTGVGTVATGIQKFLRCK